MAENLKEEEDGKLLYRISVCYVMALCRSILYNFPFPRHSSPHYHPLRSRKIAVMPLPTISGASSSPSSMETPLKGYRRNVGICLSNPSKKIFAASRLDIPESWQMPQAPCWLTYDFPKEVREKLKHQWGSDWKGQAQKWFLFKFTGKEEEINLLATELRSRSLESGLGCLPSK